MSFVKKFEMEGLHKETKLEEAATIVLGYKLKHVMKEINKYIKDDSTKNLHTMRIAFRKVRYVLEIFYVCFQPKFFKRIYSLVKELQDLIGTARDYDVLEVKLQTTAREIEQKIPRPILDKFEKEKLAARQNIKLELIKFISNKDIKKLIL
jgi:CHAD domain-containing protein